MQKLVLTQSQIKRLRRLERELSNSHKRSPQERDRTNREIIDFCDDIYGRKRM